MLVGGDFNIIRKTEEKNNNNFKARWPFVFNAIIEHLNLKEIALSGRQYTWASRRDEPTYEKLDRVLASISWEQKFPLVTVRALTMSALPGATRRASTSIKRVHRGRAAWGNGQPAGDAKKRARSVYANPCLGRLN
jgi:hypothetical protein